MDVQCPGGQPLSLAPLSLQHGGLEGLGKEPRDGRLQAAFAVAGGDDLGIGPDACRELREYMNAFLLDPKAEFPFDVAPEAVGERPVELQMEELAVAVSQVRDFIQNLKDGANSEDIADEQKSNLEKI